MHPASVQHARHVARDSAGPAVSAIDMHVFVDDTAGVLIPCPVTQIVVRFGPIADGGLDVYALGSRQRVHRKLIPRGQRTLVARLRLGMDRALLGVSAAAMAGEVIALEKLWGSAGRHLRERLSRARDMSAAVQVLEDELSNRLAKADALDDRSQLVLEAAARLARANVDGVASDLGVSSRHLRRVFRDAFGVSPKAFARLQRFRRALRVAQEGGSAGWADVAVDAGYYDQAHLIAEFRAIAGVTPSGLMKELSEGPRIG